MRDEEREKRETRQHITDLMGLLIVGGICFTIAAAIGFSIAAKSGDETKPGPEANAAATKATPADEPAPEPNTIDDGPGGGEPNADQ